MIALIITALIVVLCMAFFYLKCSFMSAFTTFFVCLLSMIISLGYYDLVSGLLINKGWLKESPPALSLLALFAVSFALLKTAADYVVASSVDLGKTPKIISTCLFGTFTGLIVSGLLLIAFAMSPLNSSFRLARFDTSAEIDINNPGGRILSADGMVAGLFSWISKGALSTKQSFDVYHADYLDQLHLSRFKDVCSIAGSKAMKVPRKGVRTMDFDGRLYTVVRVGLSNKSIDKGGIKPPEGAMSFAAGQIRLICKDPSGGNDTTGSGNVYYPKGFVVEGKLQPSGLHEITTLTNDDNIKKADGTEMWRDVAFDLPSNMKPVLLEFKLNAVLDLNVPGTIPASSAEIELELEEGQPVDTTEGN